MKSKIKKKALPNYIDEGYDFDFNEKDIENILKDIDSEYFNEFEEELVKTRPDISDSYLTPEDIKLMDKELEFLNDDLDDLDTLDPKYVFEELDSGWINDEFGKSANAKMFLKIAGSPARSKTAIIRAFEGALGSLSDVNFSDSTYFWKLDNNDTVEFAVNITDSDIVFKLICGSREISDRVKWDNKYINYEVSAFTDTLLRDAAEFLEYIDMNQLNELDIDSREYDSITDDLHNMASRLSSTNEDFMGLSDFNDGSVEEGHDNRYVSAGNLSRMIFNFSKLALLNIGDELVNAFRDALESTVYSLEDDVSYSERSSGNKHSWIIKNKDLGARVHIELDFDTESAGGGKAKFVVGYHFDGDEFNKEFIVELNDLRAFKQAADRLRDAGDSMTKNFSELMDSLAMEVESTGDSLKGFEEDAPETVREYSFPDWDDVTEITEMKFSSINHNRNIKTRIGVKKNATHDDIRVPEILYQIEHLADSLELLDSDRYAKELFILNQLSGSLSDDAYGFDYEPYDENLHLTGDSGSDDYDTYSDYDDIYGYSASDSYSDSHLSKSKKNPAHNYFPNEIDNRFSLGKDSVSYYKLSNMVKSASISLKSSNKRGSSRK